MGIEDVRNELRGKATKVAGVGINIQGGAKYVFGVKALKIFKGYKNPQQSIIEFEVLSMAPTQTDEWYKANGYPNAVGTTCSEAIGLANDKNEGYKLGLFLKAISAITNKSIETLRQPAEPEKPVPPGTKPEEAWETFVEWFGTPEKVSLAGLRVGCEAFVDDNKDKTGEVTKKIWASQPVPEGHPLATVLADWK